MNQTTEHGNLTSLSDYGTSCWLYEDDDNVQTTMATASSAAGYTDSCWTTWAHLLLRGEASPLPGRCQIQSWRPWRVVASPHRPPSWRGWETWAIYHPSSGKLQSLGSPDRLGSEHGKEKTVTTICTNRRLKYETITVWSINIYITFMMNSIKPLKPLYTNSLDTSTSLPLIVTRFDLYSRAHIQEACLTGLGCAAAGGADVTAFLTGDGDTGRFSRSSRSLMIGCFTSSVCGDGGGGGVTYWEVGEMGEGSAGADVAAAGTRLSVPDNQTSRLK